MNRHPYVDVCKKNISGHFQAVSGQNRPELGRKSEITSEMIFAHLNTYDSTPICRCLQKKNISGHFQAVSGKNRPELGRKSKITS